MRIVCTALASCLLLVCVVASAAAQSTGSIAGVVTNASGTPVADYWIYIYRPSQYPGDAYSFAQTDANGAYSFTSLASDTYYLSTTPYFNYFVEAAPNSYPGQIYGTACPPWRCTYREGAPVAVAPGQAVVGVNFTLRKGGSIVGKLYDSQTGAPIGSAGGTSFRLYDQFGNAVLSSYGYDPVNGYKITGIPAGLYFLLAPANSALNGYVAETNDGRHCLQGCAVAAGTPFLVNDEATTVVDFRLDRLGRITGRIIDNATGLSINGNVAARSVTSPLSLSGYTSSPYNEYEVLVPPGRYTVLGSSYNGFVPEFYGGIQAACDTEAYPYDGCAELRRLATVVEVAANSTVSGIDIRLDKGGSIAGGLTVTGPLAGPVTLDVLTAGGAIVRSTTPYAPGSYTISNLPAGVFFLCARGGNYFHTKAYGGPEFLAAACPSSTGQPITITNGSSASGIDLSLTPRTTSGPSSATLSGIVRDAQGQGIRALIRVYAPGGQNMTTATYSASDGTFSTTVSPGTYFLRTEADGNFVDLWHGGTCVLCGDDRGTSVSVAAGATASGLDFVLQPGGTIQGSVGAGGEYLTLHDLSGRLLKEASGSSFTFADLPSGAYYVRSQTQSIFYADVVYPNAPCLSPMCSLSAGTPITVTQGQTTSISFNVRSGGVIRGRAVVRGTTFGQYGDVVGIKVAAFDAQGEPAGRVVPMDNGVYEIRGLHEGTYYVRTVDGPNYGVANQTWREIHCVACSVTDGTPIVVAARSYVDHVDFELDLGGSITGLVVESGSGAPLDNQRVEARSPSGELLGFGITTLDGSYVIPALADGSYFVQTVTTNGYLDQRYHNVPCAKCLPGQGTAVAIASRGTVAGVNFALAKGGRISGRVTVGQTSLPDVAVFALDAGSNVVGKTVTDASGSFVLTTPLGTAYAKAQAPNRYVAQAFDRQTCPGGVCNLGAATPLTIQAGQIRAGVDFVLGGCSAMAILPGTLPATTVSHGYAATVSALGGTPPHKFSVEDGALPIGLTLASATGQLTGVATQIGKYSFTLGAIDATGCTAQRLLSIDVKGCDVALSATSLSFLAGGGQATIQVAAACPWQSSSPDSWLTPVRGISTVTITAAANSGATRYGRVTIGGKSVFVSQASTASGTPFGAMDIPLEGASVRGSIALGGWALDDVEVRRIAIFRDSVAPEPVGQRIYVGDAVRVRGARPDVETLFPAMPLKDQAGWGFLLLTNMLPGQGNGTFRLHAIAIDFEGNQTLLGSRTIVADNASSTLPFGAIDTPGQGETIAGTAFVNFGWALTPMPKTIPVNGSTISVLIDGAVVGTVDYGHYRIDIATLFSGLNNSNGAIGFRILDTTQLSNGIHTISWAVSDDGGAIEGIGSRYFHVNNAASIISAPAVTESVMASAANVSSLTMRPSKAARALRVAEMQRLIIDVRRELKAAAGCDAFAGYELVGDERRPLPVGSTMDPAQGIFTWQPGPGFLGNYQLLFEGSGCDGGELQLPIDVRIVRASR